MSKIKFFIGLTLSSLVLSSCSEKTKTPEEIWQSVVDTITYTAPQKIYLYSITGEREKKATPLVGNIGINNVKISSAGSYTTSDNNGMFYFPFQSINEAGRIVVNLEKDGYFPLTRSEQYNESGTLKAILQKKGDSQRTSHSEFSAEKGSLLHVNDMLINIPANILIQNRELYTGKVNADVYYLSPKDAEFAERMPGGDLAAYNRDKEFVDLTSYGMVNVELTDSLGNSLLIARDSSATVVFPVDKEMDKDIKSMPLWHFYDGPGLWVEEGIAYRQGDMFVGKVGHFSWWNLDNPNKRASIKGKVTNQNGDPYIGVEVNLCGQKSCYTNHNGEYQSFIPVDKDIEAVASINGKSVAKTVRAQKTQENIIQDFVIDAKSISVTAKDCHMFKQPFYSLFCEFIVGSDTIKKPMNIQKNDKMLIVIPDGATVANIILQTDFGYIKKSTDLSKGNIDLEFSPCDDTMVPGNYYGFKQEEAGFLWIIDPNKNEFVYTIKERDFEPHYIMSTFKRIDTPLVYDKGQIRKIRFDKFTGWINVDFDLNEKTYGERRPANFVSDYSKERLKVLQERGEFGETPRDYFITIRDAGYNKLQVTFEGIGDYYICDRALNGIYTTFYIKKHPSLGEMSSTPPTK